MILTFHKRSLTFFALTLVSLLVGLLSSCQADKSAPVPTATVSPPVTLRVSASTPTTSPTPTSLPPTPTLGLNSVVAEAFPLQVGATWCYQAHIEEELGGQVQVRDETITERVISQTQQADVTIFTLERVGGLNPGRFYYLVQGNNVYQVPFLGRFLADLQSSEPRWPAIYIFPLEVGASWGSVSEVPRANHCYEWYVEGQEDVDVPAGHFADCYRLVFLTSPDDTTRWFCPGVGLARLRYRHHGSVHNEDWELTSYPGMTTTLVTEPTVTPTTPNPTPDTDAVIDCTSVYPGLLGCLRDEPLVGGRLAFVTKRLPFGRTTILDLERGNVWTLSPVTLLEWSPSGNYLIAGRYIVYRYDGVAMSSFYNRPTSFWAPLDALPGAHDWLAMPTADGALLAAPFPEGETRQVLPPGSLGNDRRSTVRWSLDGWLAWSLNTDQLAEAGQFEQTLYVRPAEGDAEVTTWRLSDDIREAYYQIVDWVPGTRLILAARGMLAVSLWSWGVPLVIINANTGEITDLGVAMLLTPEAYAWHPAQPGLLVMAEGGSRYLFETGRLVLLDVTTGELRTLTGPDMAAFEPAWSPDGTLLAYAAVPASPDAVGGGDTLEHTLDGRAIYVVNPQSGETHALTHPGDAVDGWPQWSADGTRLLYTRQHDGYTDVRIVSLDGNMDELLVTGLADPGCYYGGCGWRCQLAYYPGP